MFCKNCGKEIPDNATFCTYCGAQTGTPQQAQQPQQQQPVYQQPTYQQPTYQQPTYQQPGYQQPYQQPYGQAPYESPEGKSAATAAMIWGIVSLVCSWGLILGIIFSCVGISQAKKAERLGVNNGMAKAGKIMSIIALVCSIIAAIIWIIYIIGMATLASSSYYWSY